FTTGSAVGQERIDVVYLKNGDVFKGIIIENAPNDYVKIELPGGSVFTIKYSDIVKFTRERPVTAPQYQQQSQQQFRQSEPDNQPDVQKMMYYERDKRSSGTAVLLSLALTSSGHAYAGNWGRGLFFAAGRVGAAVLALTAGIETRNHSDYLGYGVYYDYQTTEITALYWVGLGAVVLIGIWEAIDAAAEVDRYNEKLYNKMMGSRPFGLNIVPGKNGHPELRFSYSF
ncbi:MAG: hypothetical protein WBD36_05080, partial [Bacteroidota bacterium]